MEFKTVNVVFEGGTQKYSYKATMDVQVDDYVIVVPRAFPAVARVVSEDKRVNPAATKFIAGVVDLSKYEQLLLKEEKRKEILCVLEKKRKEFEELAIFEFLAEKDSSVADLLKQLKSL